MKPELKFEDWLKYELRVGEIKFIKGKLIKIDIGNKILETNVKVNVEIGDKIIVGINGDNLVIPLADRIVISPEKDIELGSRVS